MSNFGHERLNSFTERKLLLGKGKKLLSDKVPALESTIKHKGKSLLCSLPARTNRSLSKPRNMSCHACLPNVVFSKIAIRVTMSSPRPGLSGVRFQARAGDVSLQYVQTPSKAQPDS